VATLCYQNAHYLASQLEATGKFNVENEGQFFNEFTVRTSESPAALNARLREAGIIGGLDLATVDATLEGRMLLAATEMTGRAAIDRFVEVAAS